MWRAACASTVLLARRIGHSLYAPNSGRVLRGAACRMQLASCAQPLVAARCEPPMRRTSSNLQWTQRRFTQRRFT